MDSIVLLIVLPFVGALLALLGKAFHLELTFSILAVTPIAGMALALGVSFPLVYASPQAGDAASLVYELGGWPEPYGIALYLDGFAWLSSAIVVLIAVMVVFASFSLKRYRAHYFFFLMLMIGGMEVVVLTGDLFTMFVGFEIVAISAYVLIAFDQTDDGLLASLKYLLLSTVGILFFLFGVFLVYRDLGTLSLAVIRESVRAGGVASVGRVVGSTSIHFAVAALCVGIGVRTAFIPFHTWLPEAHAYAPHPISAILSGVLIKVSFFAMVRIVRTFQAAYLNELLLWIGAGTALLAVIWALAQKDAKRLLAYHSISQMGYILAAFGAAGALSSTAFFAHAFHHALFKSLLFLVAGTAIHMTGERDIYRMTPIGRRAPILALTFIVGALSIAGIPPFNGFASKQLVSAALYGHPAYVLLWIAAVGTTASFIKVSRIVVPFGRLKADAQRPLPRAGFLIHIPAVALALLCLATGLWARPLALLFSGMLGETATHSPTDSAGGSAGGVGGAGGPFPVGVFTGEKLMGVLPVLALGIALYLLVMSPPGKRLASRIETIAPELRTVLLFFVLGLGLFALVAYV